MATQAATPLTVPANLDISVNASGLVATRWPFELKAATASGIQSLGQPDVTRSVALADLGRQADGIAQGFGTVPGGGRYRLILIDAANTSKINYNFIISSTDKACANAAVSSNESTLSSESGRWMEISLLKVEEGTASIAIASPIVRACTNTRGKLEFGFTGINAGKFKLDVTAFNEGNQPVGAYSQDVLIEYPSDTSYTSMTTAK